MDAHPKYQQICTQLVLAALWLIVCGCDRTSQLADSQRAPAQVGKLVSKETQADSSAIALLEKCMAAYKRATSYQDAGRVVLGYKVDGKATQDSAPLSVAFESPNRLGLKAYQVIAGCNENRFRLRLTAGADDLHPLFRQVISRSLPARLDGSWISSDPIVAQHLSAGLAGSPPQLELLLGQQPFRNLLEGATAVALDGLGKESGQTFHIVTVQRGGARYRLWISPITWLLRRIELPSQSLPPMMLADHHITDLHLSIELDDPQLGARIDWSKWQVPSDPRDQWVRYFVAPPEVELDARLGKRIPAFQLTGLAGHKPLDTSAGATEGKVQLLIWVADHPSCQTALEQIKGTLTSLPPGVKERISTSVIWAEAEPPSGLTWEKLVTEWKIAMPLRQDLEAVGRDVLGISEAPTIVILDASHRLQLLQPQSSPQLFDALPALLARLASGENIAGDMVQKNTLHRERYGPELWLARASDASSASFTQPDTYPTEQITLKKGQTLKHDSGVVALQADASRNLWLLDNQGQLTSLDHQGKQLNKIQLEWKPPSDASRSNVMMAIDSTSKWLAIAGSDASEFMLVEIESGQRSTIAIKKQTINDLRWLDTPAGLRLSAITDAGRTLLIDPLRAQQHSGQTPATPLALVPRGQSEALASGFVILSDGRVEPIIVQDEGGARSAALAKPVSTSGKTEPGAAQAGTIERQLQFTPSRGPWSWWSDGQQTFTLARGWLSNDEPAVYVLDSQLRQLWHAPLPIEAEARSSLITLANDPLSGGPIWALSCRDQRIHFFSADGRLVDHCQLSAPVRGLALIPVGKELHLWVAYEKELVQYSIK